MLPVPMAAASSTHSQPMLFLRYGTSSNGTRNAPRLIDQ